jgi:hypothetical protein
MPENPMPSRPSGSRWNPFLAHKRVPEGQGAESHAVRRHRALAGRLSRLDVKLDPHSARPTH